MSVLKLRQVEKIIHINIFIHMQFQISTYHNFRITIQLKSLCENLFLNSVQMGTDILNDIKI